MEIIRKASITDAEAVADIYTYYVENTTVSFDTVPPTIEEMRGKIISISEKYPFLILEDSGYVIGYAYAHQWKDKAAYKYTAELTIYLRKDFSQKGRGSVLLKKLLEECRRYGIHTVIGCITDDNKSSIELCKKFGFNQASHFHNVGYKNSKMLGVVDFELSFIENS